MKDGKIKHKQKQGRDRVAIIEAFSPNADHEREKFLREEGYALADTAKTQKKIYRCVAINNDAKALLKKRDAITAHLQEQIQAIEERLQEPMPRSACILLLENRNKLLKTAIANIGQIETDLSVIEEDLYPKLNPKEHGEIFSRNKNAVAQLYARLKQHTFNIQFKLGRIDPILRDSIQSDLELLKKFLDEIESITQKTGEIYERLKGGRIPPDLYAAMANEVYEINKKKFDFEQVCKLIEDKLEISKLDAEIKQQVEELEALHERLSAVKGIIDTAYYRTNRGPVDLATQLKSVDFTFNTTDYEAKLLISSMQWDDDLTTRQEIIKERKNLLAQLGEKKKYIAQVISVIVSHQQVIKGLIGKDLDFCVKRACLYEAFTNAPHDFYQNFNNYQKALEYDFDKGIDNQQAQWYLHRLLTYTLGFSTDVPDNCVIVRHVRNVGSDLKKLKVQFEKDFPLLTVKSEFFNYNGKSYFISDSIRKNLENYTSARAKISDAFKDDNKSSEYVDFHHELQLIRESKTEIEQYIIAYEEELKINRLDLLDIKRKLSKSLLKFNLQNDSLEYQGETYVLDFPTQILVEQYNFAHKQLFEALSDNEFPVDPILFKNKKEQFAALQRNQIQIIAFLEEQRKNRKEFLDFKEKFKNHTPFVLTNTTSKEKALSFEGANYTLNYSTQHMVERYNYLYERLTKFFKNYSSTSNPLMINAELLQKITKQFIQLIESQNEIKSFVEKQRELDDLRNRFAAFSPLTLTYEGNSLVYKEKTYPLNAAIAKQIQEYNQAYGELEQAFKGENSTLDIESIKKLFNKLQQKVKPFDQIEEFGKLTKLLEKQSDLVNKRKRIVQEIIDKIKLESLGDVSKDSEEVTILKGLLQAFTRHDAEVTQLVAKIGTARNDLCLDNLSDSKEQLKKFATANHDKAGDLIKDLREEFNENLPKFSSNKRLNQFMAWIDKHILAPLYEAYYKEENRINPDFLLHQ